MVPFNPVNIKIGIARCIHKESPVFPLNQFRMAGSILSPAGMAAHFTGKEMGFSKYPVQKSRFPHSGGAGKSYDRSFEGTGEFFKPLIVKKRKEKAEYPAFL